MIIGINTQIILNGNSKKGTSLRFFYFFTSRETFINSWNLLRFNCFNYFKIKGTLLGFYQLFICTKLLWHEFANTSSFLNNLSVLNITGSKIVMWMTVWMTVWWQWMTVWRKALYKMQLHYLWCNNIIFVIYTFLFFISNCILSNSDRFWAKTKQLS